MIEYEAKCTINWGNTVSAVDTLMNEYMKALVESRNKVMTLHELAREALEKAKQ